MSRRKKPNTTFTIVPWNSSALNEDLGRRAVASESFRAGFTFDVSFRSNRKGFVVQYIRKYKSYTPQRSSEPNVGEYGWKVDYEDCDNCNRECRRNCSQFLGKNIWKTANFDDCKNIHLPDEGKVDCKIIDYWEIFYIGNKGKSWNTDRFGQSFLENDSEGTIIQIGYAYFFPYNKPVKQYKEVVELTQPIKKIFGQFVDIHNIKSANGLPASTDQPEMVGLKPIENVIVHKLTAKWGNHESKSQFHQNEGWDTVVVEESFGGSQVYKDFPWEYKKDRPFYFDADQWNEIGLNRKLDYKPPKFKCSLCKTFHFKGDWFVHHDDLPPAGFSPDTEIYSRPDSP